jgi:thioredoxin-dependent peroxiredoxin
MKLPSLLCVFVCLAIVTPVGGQPEATELKPGDMAPDFSLPGTDGKTYSLSQYRGVRPVVIAWFPRLLASE